MMRASVEEKVSSSTLVTYRLDGVGGMRGAEQVAHEGDDLVESPPRPPST